MSIGIAAYRDDAIDASPAHPLFVSTLRDFELQLELPEAFRVAQPKWTCERAAETQAAVHTRYASCVV
ncbi:hypothetical protein CYMTET_12457 [Cymbomonas tetramitiformis]|uniref:Uncharacterized protein n=1 Tax=Cymbomonas tetramitiformis TaxID=36881 RepID=A0AAE0GK34_9CHLO|nr:hypothetical protein CYMTET_12457 [Cymbomonas tetramitiformis]